MRTTNSQDDVHISWVIARTRVAPFKWLTITRLELYGAQLIAGLLNHVRNVFDLPSSQIFTWTDCTMILNWLNGNPRRFKTFVGNPRRFKTFVGNPRRFKTFVGNRVSSIIDCVPPSKWNHVDGSRKTSMIVHLEETHHTSCWNILSVGKAPLASSHAITLASAGSNSPGHNSRLRKGYLSHRCCCPYLGADHYFHLLLKFFPVCVESLHGFSASSVTAAMHVNSSRYVSLF